MPIIAIFLFSSILFIFVWDSYRLKITPTPTSLKVKKKIFENLPKNIQGDIYELGSGFGTMTLALAKRYPSQFVKSYEKALIPFLFQQVLLWFNPKKKVDLLKQDFRTMSLNHAGLVFCYLYRSIMPELAKKFEKELPEGTWVITHTFAIDNWPAYKIIYSNDMYKTPIYFYKIN